MRGHEYILNRIAEEATEVAMAALKAVRFGLDNWHPDSPDETNRGQIEHELNDLLAAVSVALKEGILSDQWDNSNDFCSKVKRMTACVSVVPE